MINKIKYTEILIRSHGNNYHGRDVFYLVMKHRVDYPLAAEQYRVQRDDSDPHLYTVRLRNKVCNVCSEISIPYGIVRGTVESAEIQTVVYPELNVVLTVTY